MTLVIYNLILGLNLCLFCLFVYLLCVQVKGHTHAIGPCSVQKTNLGINLCLPPCVRGFLLLSPAAQRKVAGPRRSGDSPDSHLHIGVAEVTDTWVIACGDYFRYFELEGVVGKTAWEIISSITIFMLKQFSGFRDIWLIWATLLISYLGFLFVLVVTLIINDYLCLLITRKNQNLTNFYW